VHIVHTEIHNDLGDVDHCCMLSENGPKPESPEEAGVSQGREPNWGQ
jgi:hypothetical protein